MTGYLDNITGRFRETRTTLIPEIVHATRVFRTVAGPAIYMLGYWFLIQLIGGVGTAFWAHIGGFAVGVASSKQRGADITYI